MAINVLISCARKSKEKQQLKEWLGNNPNIGHVYDCNDTPTDYDRESTKQDDIDRHIREVTDWFIFLCPFDFVGKWTFHELQVAAEAKTERTGLPMISLFFCKNPNEELNICNKDLSANEKIVRRSDDIGREEIDQYIGQRHYKPDEYEHGQLIDRVEGELYRFIGERLRMRRYETACNEVLPTDIFYDYNRTMPENGFDEAVYRNRAHDKEMMDAGFDHILLCGAPASGKSRSVLEFIKKFANNPENRFISVRGAQNLTGSGVGHRFISLSRLVEDLIAYDEYLDRKDLYVNAPNNQRNFIVIDQIDSMLGEDLSQIETLFHHASSLRRPSYQIVLTTTTSGYEAFRELFQRMEQMVITTSDNIQSSHRLRIIHIRTVSYEDSKWVWDQLENGSRPMPKGKVIGDYIPKLLTYNNRLIDEARQFHSKFSSDIIPVVSSGFNRNMIIRNTIAAFVRSVQLVRLMRHTGQLPLCLVIMFMKEELWLSIEEAKNATDGIARPEICYLNPDDNDFLKAFAVDVQSILGSYLINNNIIALSREIKDFVCQTVDEDDDFSSIWVNDVTSDSNIETTIMTADIALDYSAAREYDHELMTTIVDPSITMTIINDQVWDRLCDYSQYDYNTFVLSNGRITTSPNAKQEAKRAMKVWYNAFGKENPVTSMLRICTRSPMIKIDKLLNIQYGTEEDNEEDNNFSFIWSIFRKELQNERNTDRVSEIKKHKDFPLLYRMLIARMGNANKIRKEITKSNGEFKQIFMSYDMVGELYGQAVGEARSKGYITALPDSDFCVLARELQKAIELAGIEKTKTEELYIHHRQLQLFRQYIECKEYFEKQHVGDIIINIMSRPYDGTEEHGRARIGCERIMMVMTNVILNDMDFEDWMDKMVSCKIDITFSHVKTIIRNSTRTKVNCENQKQLFHAILQKANEAIRSSLPNIPLKNLVRQYGALLISEMLQQAPSLLSSRELLATGITWLDERLIDYSSETREVWESLTLSRCQKYEYNFLLKDIMNPSNGRIKDFWKLNTILREKLLACPPNFSDKWELYLKMYDNTDFDVTNYLFMNIFKDEKKKYYTLENASVNRTYEIFLKTLDDKGIKSMIERYVKTGEFQSKRLFFVVYDSIVTVNQENHFRLLLGELAWENFCLLEETNTLQLKKRKIYNVEQTYNILEKAVERQKASKGLIDDSLFNTAVKRWGKEKKENPNDPYVSKMKQFLFDLVTDDSEYMHRMGKSETFYKSRRELGYDEPRRQFRDKTNPTKRSIQWIGEENSKFKKELDFAMRTICERTRLTEKDDDDLDLLFDKLEQLSGFPKVMPNFDSVQLLLRNRLSEKAEKGEKRKFRNLTPDKILLIAQYVYCNRGFQLTTSVVTGILEGFANYYEHDKKKIIDKETVWNAFDDFIKKYGHYTYFSDITYYQLLKVWPNKLNQFKEKINAVCQHSERLLSEAINISKNTGLPIPPEWAFWRAKLIGIIGQR